MPPLVLGGPVARPVRAATVPPIPIKTSLLGYERRHGKDDRDPQAIAAGAGV